jgi:hypothetical protein
MEALKGFQRLGSTKVTKEGYLNCASDFAVDFLDTGNGFQLQLLMAVDMICHD